MVLPSDTVWAELFICRICPGSQGWNQNRTRAPGVSEGLPVTDSMCLSPEVTCLRRTQRVISDMKSDDREQGPGEDSHTVSERVHRGSLLGTIQPGSRMTEGKTEP